MKKKYLLITILVVVVLIILAGVLWFDRKAAKAPITSNPATPTSTALVTASATGSPAVSVVISTSTAKNYTGKSFSFTYPGSWNVFSASPLLITNFNGQYGDEGIVPAGGAQIAVVTTTLGGPVADIITTELMGATDVATSTITVDGIACAKAIDRANYAPGTTSQNISIYCARGQELWKIYFSYPAGDTAENAHLSDFNGILNSMKFL